jgi:putative membrane protein
MTALYVLAVPVAFGGDGRWHRWGSGPGGGWGWLWGPIVLLLWVALVATVVWFVARSARPRERSGVDRAREVLAERYARGELTTDEYRERLEHLR